MFAGMVGIGIGMVSTVSDSTDTGSHCSGGVSGIGVFNGQRLAEGVPPLP